MSTPVLSPALLKAVAAATVIGVIAVGAALFVTRPDQPPVGGPSPTPNATFSPSTPASPSAGPSAAVVSPRAPAWIPTGGMIEARSQQTATLLPDGRVLVAGGQIGPPSNDSTASAELYDPSSGSWSATGNMKGARGGGHTATLLPDGTVLVAGGNGFGSGRGVGTAELYDPVSGTWTATGDMLSAGYGGATATLLLNGKVLVAGGNLDPYRAELYDPGSGTWTATGRLVTRRDGHTATLLPDGRVLVVGGTPPVPTIGGNLVGKSSVELYDPNSGSWTATGKMDRLRIGHTATLLPDGRVLVAGGFSLGRNGKPLASAELYDPSSGSWTAAGNMVAIRSLVSAAPLASRPTATLLPDGKVLVVGGIDSSGSALASAELYDPGSGTWTATGNMQGGRANQTATLLPDGKVLVASGETIIGGEWFGPLASAELYDPGSGN